MLLDALSGFPSKILEKDPPILDCQLEFIEKFTQKVNRTMEMLLTLDEDNEKLKQGSLRQKAELCSERIRPHIMETAGIVEKVEERVYQGFWAMPRVTNILFR